jgi:hypothetical protein
MNTIYEQFALNQWISDYPDGMQYEDVLYELLNEESDLVTPWELVENHPRRELCELIEDTCISAERTFTGEAINA